MKLKSLTLRNFKGFREWNVILDGLNAEIFGDNATGKSTVADAFAWLLTGKDSLSRANFEIQPLDKAGKVIHNLETSVEAVLCFSDGPDVKLKRVYREEWTRKRGSATEELSGHPTTFFVDDIPKSEKLFNEFIAKIAEPNLFKLLTNPMYFNEVLHWQKRRELLLSVAGDISDEEVINSDNKLLPLLQVIATGKSFDDYRALIAIKRKKINDELSMIPVRIDEATRALPEIGMIVSTEQLDAEIGAAEKNLAERRETLQRVLNGSEITKKREEYIHAKYKVSQLQEARNNEAQEVLKKIDGEFRRLAADINGWEYALSSLNAQAEKLKSQREALESRMATKRDEYLLEKKREFYFEHASVCPTCKQSIPESQIDEARQIALEDFNLKRSKRLGEVDREGQAMAAELKVLAAEFDELVSQASAIADDIATLKDEKERYNTEGNEVKVFAAQKIPAIIAAEAEAGKILEAISALEASLETAATEERANVQACELVVRALQGSRAKIDAFTAGNARIKELSDQQRALGAEFEALEKELYLTEEFVKQKVNLLESRINSKFKLARFKLFDMQMNEGIKDCCETTFGGVPYNGGLNNGAKINVGLDIINTIGKHNNITMPIFIDNAESVTSIIETEAQTIKLIKPEIDDKNRHKFSKLIVHVGEVKPQELF